MRTDLSLKLRSAALIIEQQRGWFPALAVGFALLFLYLSIPFYHPIWALPIATALGLMARNSPQIALVIGLTLALPIFAYQGFHLLMLFLLFYSWSLFTVWKNWQRIAFIISLFSMPLAGFPLSLLGGFIYFFILLFSLRAGSHETFIILFTSLYITLLLSILWGIDNNAFLIYNKNAYHRIHSLNLKTSVFLNLIEGISQASSSISGDSILSFSKFLDIVIENTSILFFYDSGLYQIISITGLFYIISYLSGRLRIPEWKLSALMLLIPVILFPAYTWSQRPYNLLLPLYIGISYAVFFFLSKSGFKFSKELEIRKRREAMEYGKFGLQELTLGGEEESLDDVGGYEDIKRELKEAILTPLQNPEMAVAYGMKPAKGILLFGPPGTGKTMIMRALAKEIDYPFFYVKASNILSKWVGESEKNISEIFKIARKKAPVILFFDEIDAIAKDRRLAESGVEQRVLNTLLQELDGYDESKPVIFIAATNIPEVLDKALLRPGRIDRIIYMRPPTKKEREEIFKKKLKKLPTKDIDYKRLAEETERFTGADIAHVVEKAKFYAIDRAKKTGKLEPITMEDLLKAIKNTKPSTTTSMIEMYKRFKYEYERRRGEAKEEKEEEKLDFSKVADMEEVKEALIKAVKLPLKHPEEFREIGLEPAKGILLFGPPGTGKTYIAKAAAGEFGVSFFSISSSEVLQHGYVEGSKALKELFNKARDSAPSIVFIDEIEAIAPKRKGINPLVSQLLQEMDGVSPLKGVVVIGATNEPEELDEALLRPGRFDYVIYVGLPNKTARKEMFRIHLGKFSELYDLDWLAEKTEGYSSADIYEVCRRMKEKMLEKKISGKALQLTNKEIEDILKVVTPSVNEEMLRKYERFLKKFGQRLPK